MRKWLKWVLILIASLLGLLLAGVAVLFAVTQSKLDRRYTVPEDPIIIPADGASLARGKHLAETIYVCTFCHEENFGGQVMFEDPLTGRLAAANLTAGKGGVGARYSDSDWVRATRHGVLPDGRPGIAMSSNLFYYISDQDLGALIAYLKSVPPVDNEVPPTRLGPMGRFFLLQDPSLLPAALIDHTAPRPPAPAAGVTAEYGAYLTHMCTICHGENYAGGLETEDNPKPAKNLTPAGDLANWSEDEFIQALRTGETPSGYQLDSEAMPWKVFGQMTDDELRAVFLFLRSLPSATPPTPAP